MLLCFEPNTKQTRSHFRTRVMSVLCPIFHKADPILSKWEMVPTAQPAESEPQRATPVLSRRKVVAEAPLGGMSSTFPLGLASTIVDLCNSPSMISLPIFHERWEDITRLETITFWERENWSWSMFGYTKQLD